MVIDAMKKNKAEEGVGSAGWRQGRLQLSTSKTPKGLTEKGHLTQDPKEHIHLWGCLPSTGCGYI